MRPKAKLTAMSAGEFCPRSWFQFSKIAPTCRERMRAGSAAAVDEMGFRCGGVRDLTNGQPGQTWDGFKLVTERSIRKCADETKVIQAFSRTVRIPTSRSTMPGFSS